MLPEEVTSLPEELDEIYIRFTDLGIDVVEDAEKPLPPTTKGIVTIDGTIEEKEMDQREEVQADIVAAASGIVDKTNDPVRMYLREMGTVKLLDRQGEVEIAKRIEKGERRVYKALSQNRIILEEILKIYESAKKDTRVIKEMIDLAMLETTTRPSTPRERRAEAVRVHGQQDQRDHGHLRADPQLDNARRTRGQARRSEKLTPACAQNDPQEHRPPRRGYRRPSCGRSTSRRRRATG